MNIKVQQKETSRQCVANANIYFTETGKHNGSKVMLMVEVMKALMVAVGGDDGDDVETRVKLCLVPSLQLPVKLLNPPKHRH